MFNFFASDKEKFFKKIEKLYYETTAKIDVLNISELDKKAFTTIFAFAASYPKIIDSSLNLFDEYKIIEEKDYKQALQVINELYGIYISYHLFVFLRIKDMKSIKGLTKLSGVEYVEIIDSLNIINVKGLVNRLEEYAKEYKNESPKIALKFLRNVLADIIGEKRAEKGFEYMSKNPFMRTSVSGSLMINDTEYVKALEKSILMKNKGE